MNRSDCRLHLILAGPTMPQRLVDQNNPLIDGAAIPQRPVLIVQQDDVAGLVETGGGARMLQ